METIDNALKSDEGMKLAALNGSKRNGDRIPNDYGFTLAKVFVPSYLTCVKMNFTQLQRF